jgi:hypothetical protein
MSKETRKVEREVTGMMNYDEVSDLCHAREDADIADGWFSATAGVANDYELWDQGV